MSKTKRQLIVLVAILVLGGAFLWTFEYGPRARGIDTTAATEASGRGFAIAVPDGFEVVRDERMKAVIEAGGVVIVATGRSPAAPGESGFRASIVVASVAQKYDGGLSNEPECAAMAQAMTGTISGTTLVGQKIIPAVWGPACQYEMVEKDRPGRGAIGTVVYRDTSMWVVTCNLDPRDGRARSACDSVLRSWKFTASS
jgi:hypothetical protein